MTPRASNPSATPSAPEFEIDDAKSFDENLSGFLDSLTPKDAVLAAVAQREVPRLVRGEITQAGLLDAFKQALESQSR